MADNFYNSGTLIIAIPFKNGFVISADTRTLFQNSIFPTNIYDRSKKIFVRKRLFKTVCFAMSGIVSENDPTLITQYSKLEDYIANSPKIFDGKKLLNDFFRQRRWKFDTAMIDSIVEEMVVS